MSRAVPQSGQGVLPKPEAPVEGSAGAGDDPAASLERVITRARDEERIIIVAPVGNDAPAIAALLDHEGLATKICNGVEQGACEIRRGAGALLLTEEALESEAVSHLFQVLQDQPRWSELPLIILTTGGEPRLVKLLDLVTVAAGAVSLLERPVSGRTLVRSVEVALRSRQRQYQVRDLIDQLATARGELQQYTKGLENAVADRTQRLNETIQELEGFSYSIAHDMRAPLRAMRGFANLLTEEYGAQLDSSGKDYLERIGTSAERLDALIRDVLNYTRVVRSDIPLSTVDTERLLQEIIESYPNLQDSTVTILLTKPLPPVEANPAALTQVFSNLLGNAVKFVPPGVAPRIKVWAEAAPAHGSKVRFWFEDNGIGIDPEFHDRIFKMFQRLHHTDSYEGTGIGLAIVRKAVERMGGAVGVEPAEGQGSRFWVELNAGLAGGRG